MTTHDIDNDDHEDDGRDHATQDKRKNKKLGLILVKDADLGLREQKQRHTHVKFVRV